MPVTTLPLPLRLPSVTCCCLLFQSNLFFRDGLNFFSPKAIPTSPVRKLNCFCSQCKLAIEKKWPLYLGGAFPIVLGVSMSLAIGVNRAMVVLNDGTI